MTYVFALAHLAGVAGPDALAASGLVALVSRYADGENGGWFSCLDLSGNVIDSTKSNYAHVHALLATASAVTAGIPGAEPALAAAMTAIEQHFWSDAEGCALENWNADFTELEPLLPGPSTPVTPAEPDRRHRAGQVAPYLVNGASGFIAGRSVWREVVSLVAHQREEFLTSVALPRLERLVDVAEDRARPWTEVTRPAA